MTLFLLCVSQVDAATPGRRTTSEAVEPRPALDQARGMALWTQGRKLLDEDDPAGAALKLERAWDLVRRDDILLDLATAQERQGDLASAIDTLRRFQGTPEEQRKVADRLAELETRTRVQAVRSENALSSAD